VETFGQYTKAKEQIQIDVFSAMQKWQWGDTFCHTDCTHNGVGLSVCQAAW